MCLCPHRQMLEELIGGTSVSSEHPAVCFPLTAGGSAVLCSIHHRSPPLSCPEQQLTADIARLFQDISYQYLIAFLCPWLLTDKWKLCIMNISHQLKSILT